MPGRVPRVDAFSLTSLESLDLFNGNAQNALRGWNVGTSLPKPSLSRNLL